jgi:RHS repeat-associated protein
VLEYDPTGALLFRKVGTTGTWYIGPFATVTASVPDGCTASADCTPAGAQVGAHVLLGGNRIATVRAADVLYYHRDMRGSVVATTLSGGRVGVRYRYTEYGLLDRTDVTDPAGESELGYTGNLRLTGSLLHLQARVYDADLKRFLQPDVVELLRYTYVAGDPVNFIDPTGKETAAGSPSGPPLPGGATASPTGVATTWDLEGWSCSGSVTAGASCVSDDPDAMNLTQVASGNLLVPSRLTDASGNVDKAGKGRTDEMMSRMKYGRGAGRSPSETQGLNGPAGARCTPHT